MSVSKDQNRIPTAFTMEAKFLYLLLAGLVVLGCLFSLSASLPARLTRATAILGCYAVLVLLFFVDPPWRVALVWVVASLSSGLIVLTYDTWITRRAMAGPWGHLADRTSHWWLVPLGLLGWPDMLAQTLELAVRQWRVFGKSDVPD
jgi:hypothetical protein